MKRFLLSLVAIATLSSDSLAQAPESFNYQAVIRDAGGLILNNQSVGLRLTIQLGSIGGPAVYTETFASTTNDYGIVNLQIGTGTSTDDFSIIDWANGPFFMETAVDVLGGTNYSVMGTSQLMSVPYALYSKKSESTDSIPMHTHDSIPSHTHSNPCNFSFPEGLKGVFQTIDVSGAGWSPTPGTNAYVLSAYSTGYISITDSPGGAGYILQTSQYPSVQQKKSLNNPIVLSPSATILGSGSSSINCLVVPSQGNVSPVTINLTGVLYTVPMNKILVITNHYDPGCLYVNTVKISCNTGIDYFLGQPIVVSGIGIVEGQGIINGYLVDDDYFSGCIGGN